MSQVHRIVLEGGAEFNGRMAEVDRKAIELAGGLGSPVRILPTAAAPDHNHGRAGANGLRWFQYLGARDVAVVPVIDSHSANDLKLSEEIKAAQLIYLLGGFPGYLAATLSGSLTWQAATLAWGRGAVIAGSSAGAMVLCETLYDPYQNKLLQGLGLLPGVCLLPHHNQAGQRWAAELTQQIPDHLLVGVDEQTGLIGEWANAWRVYGAGQVTVYRGEAIARYAKGQTLHLE